MILLLGGTGETASLAEKLANMGYRVLVSTATDIPLEVTRCPGISRRTGPLEAPEIAELIHACKILGIVDATHPYAVRIRETARQIAERMGIPYITYIRPEGFQGGEKVILASDHEEAARMACSFQRTILLTIGSRNLGVYVREAARAGLSLAARVLPHSTSLQACRSAGLDEKFIIKGRGPFSVEENRAAIQKTGAGVLVTKDGGDA